MKAIEFLRDLDQNYKQFDVKWPIWISYDAFSAREEEDIIREIVIYDGLGTLCIGTKEEFDLFKKACSDHDYRITDNNILFSTTDKKAITGIVNAVEEYYETHDYSLVIEGLISVLEPVNKLEKKL